MYADRSFKTKKALRDAIAAGQQIRVFQPGPFAGSAPQSGKVYVEGPNFEAHRWYAEAWLVDGVIKRIK